MLKYALLMVLAALAAEHNLTVLIDGYSGEVLLNISSSNFTYSTTFSKSVTVSVPAGNYDVKVFALNKTFFKSIRVENDTVLKFNLVFTNSTENVSTFYHLLVYPTKKGFEVSEVVIFTNSGDKNFEGDIYIPMPAYKNFRIESSSLSFIDYELHERHVVLKDLLIAENSSGQVSMVYQLKSNVLEVRLDKPSRFMLLTTADVLDKSHSLNYVGVKNFGGSEFKVYEGFDKYFYIEFGSKSESSYNPLAMAGIFLIAGGVFLYFYEKRGGWRL